jgi:hypothetical protein
VNGIEITTADVAEAVEELALRLSVPLAAVWDVVGSGSIEEQAAAIAKIELERRAAGLELSAPDAGQSVIIPSADAGYLELARGASGGVKFRKQILTVGPGQTLIHPKTGRRLTLDDNWYATVERNFRNKVCDLVQFPMADAQNQHTEDPLRNGGQVVDLERRGNKVYAVIEARKPEVIEGLRNGTILGASAMLNLDYTSTKDGSKVGPTLLHVAATNRPYLTEMEPYEELAASASPGREVLMLTAASTPPATTRSREPYAMPQTLAEPTWDDLDRRIARFADLTGYAGDAEGLTSHDVDAARYLAMSGQPARVADLRPASPVTDIRNAVEEMAAIKGYDRSALGLSRALDDVVAAKAETLPLDLGDELLMAMTEGDGDLMLAAGDGYALADYGDKPKLPCDSPELVRSSWAVLHQHYRHRLSAQDFADARSALMDAAAGFGFSLDDGAGGLDPAGTPDVAASYAQLPLSMAASEVDRYLELTGQRVPQRSPWNPADMRLSGAVGGDELGLAAVMAGAASVLPGMTEADLIAARQARTGFFTRKATKVKGQTVTHDFSDGDDPTATANPTRGGVVHPEIASLMREHNGGPLGQIFGGEHPHAGSKRIKPAVRSGNKVTRSSGSSTLAAMSVPPAPQGHSHGAHSGAYLGV